MRTSLSRTGTGVVYDVTGNASGVPLMLLHGGSGRRQWFDGLTRSLASDALMIRPDLPGHGASPPTPGRYRLEDSAGAVAGVLDHSGLGPCWVVGHSHGAHVAAVLAADRPDLVSGVVVGDAPMRADRVREHHVSTAEVNRCWRALAEPGLSRERRLDGFLKIQVPGPDGPTTLGEVFARDHPYVQEMVECLASHDGDFLDAVLLRFDDTYHRLRDGLLCSLGKPLIVLQADREAGGLLSDDDVEHIAGCASTVEVHRLRGVGHGLQLQDPSQVAAALRTSALPRWPT